MLLGVAVVDAGRAFSGGLDSDSVRSFFLICLLDALSEAGGRYQTAL